MKKRSICILNCVLSFIVFLVAFGNLCFLWGTIADNPKGSDLTQWCVLTFFYFVLFGISLYLIHDPYYTRKPLLTGAIFSLAFDVFILLALAFLALTRGLENMEINFVSVVTLFVPLIIGGLYFYAAFKKK